MRAPFSHRGNHSRGAHEILRGHVHDEADGDRGGFPLQIEADKGFLSPLRRAGGRLHRHGGRPHEERLHYYGLQRSLPLLWPWRDST
uniref:Uncharacterized protein n=1 Tax=Picea sitchensis TaxID=3332 RepID=A9NR40_PICSI|nr:unknown [Picea sitchensis]